MGAVAKEVEKNNLEDFKKYIESDESGIRELCTDIQYSYSTPLNIYRVDTDEVVQVNPNTVFEDMGFGVSENQNEMMYSGGAGGMDVWRPLIGDNELLEKQYDIIAGRLPEKLSEVVLIVNENNEISDFTLYSLGLKDSSQLEEMMQDIQAGKEFETLPEEYSYEEILALRFKFLPQSDLYVEIAGKWSDFSEDMEYVQNALENALEIKVVGIIRPSENASISSTEGVIGYCPELMEYAVEAVNESPVVKQQISEPDIDVFTGLPFESGNAEKIDIEMIMSMLDMLSEEEKAQYVAIIEQMRVAGMNDDQIANMLSERMAMQTDATYEGNLEILGVGDLDKPSAINIYPKDFEAKDTISSLIEEYNRLYVYLFQIQYTDYVGLLMSSVTTIINTISYVLVAFVSISLVVSSIMIGIITYISVLERTREIGVLRAMGASKRDISRVFNAETLIVGFIAGAVGIGLTLLLNIPINAIIEAVADIKGVAALPAAGGIILVMISMFLTFVAGLIPSRIAANKDPVVALRTE